MQVSRLLYKMEEESKGIAESITRKQLREKLAALPRPRLARATDALAMIFDGVKGSLVASPTEPKLTFSVTPPIFPNWRRVKLALLKSIPTGTFIDVQFYAYNAIAGDLPLDPRPLFTSSIMIEEWGPAITTRKREMLHNSLHSNLLPEWPSGLTPKLRVWWMDQLMIMKLGTERSLKNSPKGGRYCMSIARLFLEVANF